MEINLNIFLAAITIFSFLLGVISHYRNSKEKWLVDFIVLVVITVCAIVYFSLTADYKTKRDDAKHTATDMKENKAMANEIKTTRIEATEKGTSEIKTTHEQLYQDVPNIEAPSTYQTTKQEDYNLFINSNIYNSDNTDISVIIIDDNKISSSLSNIVADIYKKAGYETTIGLINAAFFQTTDFQELTEGNPNVIEKLKLNKHTDYLAIGKLDNYIKQGTLEKGTVVCSAELFLNVIDVNNKRLVKSFTISNISGNGVTESQAKERALQKLMDRYYNDYSSL